MKNKNNYKKAQKLLSEIANKRKKLTSLKYNRSLNMISDFAECYARDRYNLELVGKNTEGYDAKGKIDNKKYQIKYTTLKDNEGKRKFASYPGRLDIEKFQYLIVVVFDDNYKIVEVFKIKSILLKHRSHWMNETKSSFKIGQVYDELIQLNCKVIFFHEYIKPRL